MLDRQTGSQANLPDVLAAPKGAAWLAIPYTSYWHCRTAGAEEEEE